MILLLLLSIYTAPVWSYDITLQHLQKQVQQQFQQEQHQQQQPQQQQQLPGTENLLFHIPTILRDKNRLTSTAKLPNISTQCMQAGTKLLLPIYLHPEQAGFLPGGKMIDAFGKIPERLFLGNKELIGAYDECSAVDVAKYCRSPVYLFGKIKVGSRSFKK